MVHPGSGLFETLNKANQLGALLTGIVPATQANPVQAGRGSSP
jgi:hypothetical protein